MRMKHFTTNGERPTCGTSRHTGFQLVTETYLVTCERCMKSKAYKAAIAADFAQPDTTTSDAKLNQPSYAYDNAPRYQIRTYRRADKNGFNEFFKVIDTFNGGTVMAKGFTREADAITRRDELNQFQTRKAVR